MQLKPGEVRESQIKRHFQNAQIILLLLSADFYGDKKCTELCEQAIARSSKGAARVIPIVLRPCLDDPAVQNFIPLPKNGVPITTWENRGEAIAEVAKGIREVVQEMLAEQR